MRMPPNVLAGHRAVGVSSASGAARRARGAVSVGYSSSSQAMQPSACNRSRLPSSSPKSWCMRSANSVWMSASLGRKGSRGRLPPCLTRINLKRHRRRVSDRHWRQPRPWRQVAPRAASWSCRNGYVTDTWSLEKQKWRESGHWNPQFVGIAGCAACDPSLTRHWSAPHHPTGGAASGLAIEIP